jgi:hypothetical protein
MTQIYSVDAATGEQELRDMTQAEQAHFDNMKTDFDAKKAAADTAAADKAALLDKLGITAEEAQLLIS